MNPYPEKGDIWRDDDNEYIMFMTEPHYDGEQDVIIATILKLKTGKKQLRYFEVDEKTGTLYDWWERIG